jgi:hypothetical protein
VPAAGVRPSRNGGAGPIGYWRYRVGRVDRVDRVGWGNHLVRGQADSVAHRLGRDRDDGSADRCVRYADRVAIDLPGAGRHRHGHADHATRSHRHALDAGRHHAGRHHADGDADGHHADGDTDHHHANRDTDHHHADHHADRHHADRHADVYRADGDAERHRADRHANRRCADRRWAD